MIFGGRWYEELQDPNWQSNRANGWRYRGSGNLPNEGQWNIFVSRPLFGRGKWRATKKRSVFRLGWSEGTFQNSHGWNRGGKNLVGDVTQSIFGCKLKELIPGHDLIMAR